MFQVARRRSLSKMEELTCESSEAVRISRFDDDGSINSDKEHP